MFLPLEAAEQHGLVKFNGLPVPGAAVTATQGEKRSSAVTGPEGFYSFPDLADGVWTFQVEMLCFAPLKREIAVAPNAPAPGAEWELTLLPRAEMHAERSAAVLSNTAGESAGAKTGAAEGNAKGDGRRREQGADPKLRKLDPARTGFSGADGRQGRSRG